MNISPSKYFCLSRGMFLRFADGILRTFAFLGKWVTRICRYAVVCCMSTFFYVNAATWTTTDGPVGVPYQTMDELRSFYKFTEETRATRKGAYALIHEDSRVEFGPNARELRINGVDIELSYPLRRNAEGKLLLSRTDWVYRLDPILRPTYIRAPARLDTVVIDAAHGGNDRGNACATSHEASVVMQVALALKAELEKNGINCVLTRTGDYFLSDRQRVRCANAVPNAVFVSLHIDSAGPEAGGPSTYALSPVAIDGHPRPGDAFLCKSAALAYALEHALSTETRKPGAGCRHAHYSLLSSLEMPAVMVQLGYATNPQECTQLNDPKYYTQLAVALARGINAYKNATSPQAVIPTEQPVPKRETSTKREAAAPRPTTQNTKSRSTATKPAQRSATKPKRNRR